MARALLPVVLLVLLVTELLVDPHRATAGGPPPAEVVAAVTGAYGSGGTVAVVVARQLTPDPDLPPRAADARSARLTSRSADNGQIAHRPFPAASMVKLFLAEDVLRRVRSGTLELSAAEHGRLAAMIRSSDDPAASEVWVRYDGPRTVRAVAMRYDLTGTAPPQQAGQWGRTTTTARDLARFLALLPVLAHPDDAATLLEWMRAATPLAADGFDQRFGLFGADDQAAVKQGWMCCVDGELHVHSVGVVGRTVVVLLSEVPREVGYDAARDALTAAAAPVPPPRRP